MPTLLGNAEKQLIENMVPFVNQGILKQKIYIIPDEKGFENLFVALNGEYSRKECVKIDTVT